MKIQHKSSLLIFVIGIIFLISVSTIYYYNSRSFAIKNTQQFSHIIVDEFAHHIEEKMRKDAQVAYILANAPLIAKALTLSKKDKDRNFNRF